MSAYKPPTSQVTTNGNATRCFSCMLCAVAWAAPRCTMVCVHLGAHCTVPPHAMCIKQHTCMPCHAMIKCQPYEMQRVHLCSVAGPLPMQAASNCLHRTNFTEPTGAAKPVLPKLTSAPNISLTALPAARCYSHRSRAACTMTAGDPVSALGPTGTTSVVGSVLTAATAALTVLSTRAANHAWGRCCGARVITQ